MKFWLLMYGYALLAIIVKFAPWPIVGLFIVFFVWWLIYEAEKRRAEEAEAYQSLKEK